MNCPHCLLRLETTTHRGVEVDECVRCRGMWFDVDEVALAARCAVPPITLRMPSEMDCPACRERMDIAQLGPVEVERCPACKGTFLQQGELRSIMKGRTPQADPRAERSVDWATRGANEDYGRGAALWPLILLLSLGPRG